MAKAKSRSNQGRVANKYTKKGMEKATQGRVKKGEIITPGKGIAKALQSKAARTYIDKAASRVAAGQKASKTRKANIAADKRKAAVRGVAVGTGLGASAGYAAGVEGEKRINKTIRKIRGLGR